MTCVSTLWSMMVDSLLLGASGQNFIEFHCFGSLGRRRCVLGLSISVHVAHMPLERILVSKRLATAIHLAHELSNALVDGTFVDGQIGIGGEFLVTLITREYWSIRNVRLLVQGKAAFVRELLTARSTGWMAWVSFGNVRSQLLEGHKSFFTAFFRAQVLLFL